MTTLFSCGGGGPEDSINNPISNSKEAQENREQEAQQANINYQIGPNWDATQVSGKYLNQRNEFLTSKIALSTVEITSPWERGTGFFLGKHNDQYLIGTSAHVLKNVATCLAIPLYAKFKIQDKSYRCRSLVGIWPDIDFALFTITEVKEQVFLDSINPLSFDYKDPLKHGTALATMGVGNYKNPKGLYTLKEDRDCMIYSPTGQLAKVKKSDKTDDTITAFATGCDISPGDSGAAIVNRESQRAIGVVWATSAPKPVKIKTNEYLDSLLGGYEDSNDVWKYFSYGVSSYTIRKRLIRWTDEVKYGGFGLQKRIKTVEKLIEL